MTIDEIEKELRKDAQELVKREPLSRQPQELCGNAFGNACLSAGRRSH